MKKKTVLKLLFIASCLVAMYSLFYSHETNTLDSLAFQNVEALAQGENDDDAHCYGYGSVDCRGHKVEYKISGYSLE
ncbi:MAG: NVEALA domain-containing protein [Parabacteroides merdae]